MKALVGAFNQEKALVGAFSVITNLRMQLFKALLEAVTRVCVAAAEEAGATAVPLPVRGPGSWSLVFISPVLAMLGGQLDLVLIGETEKVNKLKPPNCCK